LPGCVVWGPTLAAGYLGAAARYPHAVAIVDELGTLTFEEVDRRTNRLANALAEEGLTEGDAVAILCRNHRYFVEATVACSKLGAHAVYLNTAFAGPQVAEVLGREGPVAVIHDQEFEPAVRDAPAPRGRYVAFVDEPSRAHAVLEKLVRRRLRSAPQATHDAGPKRDLDLGHDRHSQRRQSKQSRITRSGGGVPVDDPAARPRDDDDRRTSVSLLGLRPHAARHGSDLDARPAPAL